MPEPALVWGRPGGRGAWNPRWSEWVLILLAIGLGGLLTLPAARARPLGIDEHVSVWIAEGDHSARLAGTTLGDRSLDYSATPPLSFSLQHLSLAAFGQNPLALRLPALASYFLSILAIAVVARDLAGPGVAGLSALVLAVDPDVLRTATQGRPYGPALLLGIVAMGLTIRWARPAGAGPRHRWGVPLAWCAVNSALIYTHYIMAVMVGFEMLYLAWAAVRPHRPPVRGGPADPRPRPVAPVVLTLAGVALVVAGLPLMAPLLRLAGFGPYLNWTTAPPRLADLVLPLAPVAILLPLGVALRWRPAGRSIPGRTAGAESSRRPLAVVGSLLAWYLVPAGSLWLLGFHEASLAQPRYRMPFVPPVCIAIAVSVALLPGRVVRGLAIAGLLAAFGTPWALAGALAAPPPDPWQRAAAIVNQRGVPGELLLVQSGLTEASILPAVASDPVWHSYLTCRIGSFYLAQPHPRLSLPVFWRQARTGELEALYTAAIARSCREHGGFWLIGATDTDLTTRSTDQMRRWLARRGRAPAEEIRLPDQAGRRPELLMLRYQSPP